VRNSAQSNQEMMSSGMGPTIILRSNNFAAGMSHLGQQQIFHDVRVMSALPLKADIRRRHRDVSFGPIPDIRSSRPLWNFVF
jgi:hypothetical protein